MSEALTVSQNPNGMAVANAGGFNREQIDLIKQTVAVGTSDLELQLFLEVCKTTGLNPFQRQIYAIMRNTWNPKTRENEARMTIQTGIDGYRLTAARTGKHAGTSDAEYGPENSDGYPIWAKVTVHKLLPNGSVADFTATARWREYVQASKEGKPTGQWPKMPYLMLGKCAEALALRKAFPAELSGVYTAEEMSQADSYQVDHTTGEVNSHPPAKQQPPQGITEAQRKRMFAIAKENGISNDQLKKLMDIHFCKDSTKTLTQEEYEELCDKIIPSTLQVEQIEEASFTEMTPDEAQGELIAAAND